MSRKRIVLLVLGSLFALIGFGLLAGGAVVGWATATQRDEDGYFTTSRHDYETSTAAITSRDVDLGRPGPAEWWSDHHIVTVRLDARENTRVPVFVGIAPAADIDTYFAGVRHDEVKSVDLDPFRVDYRILNSSGTATPTDPQAQSFWVAAAVGPGEQRLTWEAEPGRWTLVIMNADATPGVSVDMQAGVRIEYLAQIALALGLAGLVFLALGTALIVPAAREHHRHTAAVTATTWPAPQLTASEHTLSPVSVSGHIDADVSRWKWLIKWFLAIPHFIVLALLWIAFVVLTIVAFFAILFTGRYPRSIFDFNVGVMRWTWRVMYYCTSVMATDKYPPFTLGPASHPATLDIAYPDHLSRGLIFVKSWLLAIPHLVVVGILASATTLSGAGRSWTLTFGGGLIGVLALIAVVTLLFTGTYPADLHALLVGLNRWVFRVIAYVALMTDRYPPFRLDQGADDPAPPAPLPPPPTDTVAEAELSRTGS